MLPTFTALFDGHRWHCQKRGIRYTQRDLHDAQIGIARARLLAVGLATRESDEPAALLFALLLEVDALGDARDTFPVFVVRHFVKSRGFDLPLDLPDRIALRALRARALTYPSGLAHLRPMFDELCALVTARLRPLP